MWEWIKESRKALFAGAVGAGEVWWAATMIEAWGFWATIVVAFVLGFVAVYFIRNND